MDFNPINIKLKNGESAKIRMISPSDALEMINYLQTISRETDAMLRYPEEFTLKEEDNFKRYAAVCESSNTIELVMTLNGKIIGHCGLRPIFEVKKCIHRCSFGISVLKSHWGKGVGYNLLKALILKAVEIGYEQIELDVVSDNTSAIGLYKKFGFKEYGHLPNAFKLKDGSYQDLRLMYKRL
ncbi:MAG: GNAT family N-acetyltransferase [Clostridium sp.]|uniref:GNAT family N-acetyltransferase n=1 Tax=Clostridium sp. TaxID=1506 RepID=UPI002FCA2924